MPKINVLDKNVAELIAAGEVVERPSSVVKELVENAIDAGATAVTVEIKNGGISFIRVTDNGCGMAREDIPLAFLRHATSKIHKEEDLESILTLGFRGEALASISAVARVELLTREADASVGYRYRIEGGEEATFDEAGCPVGTTIVVRDIFYNIPARMKFLKKNVSEANSVASIVDKIALSHPEVSFQFIRDGKNELHTPGDNDLRSCIYTVISREFANSLVEVDYQNSGFRLRGFITRPTLSRPTRSLQNFFINGRFIKSRTCMVALEEAFKGSIQVGKFPGCVLFLEIPPNTVDVNVHPTKLEVRFTNEKVIFDTVYYGVKSALSATTDRPQLETGTEDVKQRYLKEELFRPTVAGRDSQLTFANGKQGSGAIPKAPSLAENQKRWPLGGKLQEGPVESTFYQSEKANGFTYERQLPPQEDIPLPEEPPAFLSHGSGSLGAEVWENAAAVAVGKEKPSAPPASAVDASSSAENAGPAKRAAGVSVSAVPPAETAAFRLVGEAFDTYILVQLGEELLLVDKHAAHERYLYEKLRESADAGDRQMLLVPLQVTLSMEEYDAALAHTDVFAAAGFQIEDFGPGMVRVYEVPMVLGESDIGSLVAEIADNIKEKKTDVSPKSLDDLYHNVACRAAVKAHDKSSLGELQKMVEELIFRYNIKYCPHGRPVAITIPKREIEKKFGRV